jgi:hypothetical protein
MRIWIGGLVLCCIAAGAVAQPDDVKITRKTVHSFYKSLNLLTPTPIVDAGDMATDRRRGGRKQPALKKIYGNDLAKQAFGQKAIPFPIGSVLINEKTESGRVTAIGIMVKRAERYDSAHGDWEYFFADNTGEFSNGRLAECIACHTQVKSEDYIFYPNAP